MILIHIHMIMGVWSHAPCEEGLQSDGGGGRRRRKGEGECGGVGGGREGGEGVDEEVEEVWVAEEGRVFVESREDWRAVADEGQPCCYVMVPQTNTQEQSHLQTERNM